jgi:hypothetical protein
MDPFPLPRIDQIIDSTTGCARLSFLDAYSIGVLDTGVSRSTCSWAPSTAQFRPRGGMTTEASGEDPHEEAPHEENDD